MSNAGMDLDKLANTVQNLLIEKHMVENKMLILQSVLDYLSFNDKGEFTVTGDSISEISDILHICNIDNEIVDDVLIVTWDNSEDEKVDKEWVSKLP